MVIRRFLLFCITVGLVAIDNVNANTYRMPAEDEPHTATWIQWPHWKDQKSRYEHSWIEMTSALHTGEDVHIVVYNTKDETRVKKKLNEKSVDMTKIFIHVHKTDDVWVRDNGPIFAYDKNNNLVIQDWGFNGWGNKQEYSHDDKIPTKVANDIGMTVVNVAMINEGGSVEVDGQGTLMAKRSSILNNNRNPGMTQAEAEAIFTKYLGVTNFIWLDGKTSKYDITDDHIDGTARFAPQNRIITFPKWEMVTPSEFDILKNAKNSQGEQYTIVELPTTKKIVPTIGDYGIYINYYVGNNVVLIPRFGDPHDMVAMQILQEVYPSRTMHLIDFTQLFLDGGLVHCVTQQQPIPLK